MRATKPSQIVTEPELPIFDPSTDFETAQAALLAAGLGDGLPLVPPIRRRLAAMLAAVAAPDAVLGHLPPLFGEVTARAVAYQCVLAGAHPEELPVVLAAASACLAPELNLLGLATTTGSAALALVVHGAIARRLAMNASVNALGPGNRANACIGRALALVLRNIGGARPETGDMATLGQPGKYTFCLAENDASLLPPLPVRRGRTAGVDSGGDSGGDAVTVLGVSGTAEVLPEREGDSAEAILGPMAQAMRAAFLVSGAHRQPEPLEQVFLLPPELARLLLSRGWNLARIQDYLYAAIGADGLAVAAGPEAIHPIVAGGPGIKMAHLPLWGGGTRLVTRAI